MQVPNLHDVETTLVPVADRHGVALRCGTITARDKRVTFALYGRRAGESGREFMLEIGLEQRAIPDWQRHLRTEVEKLLQQHL